jgi:hypothetical protein
MAYIEPDRPLSAIFVDLASQFAALVQKEGQLARTEMSEKVGEIGMALVFVVAGAVLLFPGLVILLQAAAAGLVALGLAVGWASLVVGGVALAIGLALLAVGARRLKAERLAPAKTIGQLQRDAALAAQHMRYDYGIPQRPA